MFGFYGFHCDLEGTKKEGYERLCDTVKKQSTTSIDTTELDKPIALNMTAVKNFSLSALQAMNEEVGF